jgi:uncharacterized membrane protein
MADQRVSTIFKLPREVQDKMKGMTPDIEAARKAIATMKELGMDTKELEDRLDWAEKVRATLLREFT